MANNPVIQSEPGDKGLRSGSIGLLGNVTIGLSATAPTYSLAATLGYVVHEVHEKARRCSSSRSFRCRWWRSRTRNCPQTLSDCGTTFTWGTRAFGPWVGWIGGWGLAVSAIIVLANGPRSPVSTCASASGLVGRQHGIKDRLQDAS